MTDPTDPATWKSLSQIRKELGGGRWRTSTVFEEVGIATKNQMPPSQYWILSEEDRAFMTAYSRVESTMAQYESHIASKESKKKGKT